MLISFVFLLMSVWACCGCSKSGLVLIDGEQKPRTMKELMEIPGGDWERVDIGRMNLICARDADGTARIDVERLVKELDKWAVIAKKFGGDRPFENARLLGFCVKSINYCT